MATQAIASPETSRPRETVTPRLKIEAYVLNRFLKVAYADVNDMVLELPILVSHREIYPVFVSLEREGIIKPVRVEGHGRCDIYMVPYILVDEALKH